MSDSLPRAVVLGLSPTGLYVARELGRAGVPLLGVDREFACGSSSRYFRGREGVWHESSSVALLSKLKSFSTKQPLKPVLIPTNDHYIEFIIENYPGLADMFHIAQCYGSTAELLLDKWKFHELCTKYGVATPGVWKLTEITDLGKVVDEIPMPCLLKPTLIHKAKPYMRGKKVVIINRREELISLAEKLPIDSGSWLIQEIIPGEESRISVLAGYSGSDRLADDVFTARKLRQYPPGFGSASRVISEHCAETVGITLRFIKAIGFKGIYGAEFKRDSRDGKLKVIEINPRPTLWFYVSHAAGKRLVERAYCDLVGLPLPHKTEQHNGVLWQYVIKDFASAVLYKLYRGRFSFSAPDLAAGGEMCERCWPVFSFSDPLPFFAELYVYAVKSVRRCL